MIIYNILRIIIYIGILPFLIFNKKLSKFVKKRLFEKYDFEFKDCIWFHMASMGEVNLSFDIIKTIVEKDKENILISVMTDTGMETALNKYKKYKNIKIIYFPLDDYVKIKKICKKINIKKLILVETEIWPNLININSKKSEIYLINGRITNKSYKNYIKFKFILKKTLNKINVILMQTIEDAERIIKIGADKNRVEICGNLKFNIELSVNKDEFNKELRKKINFNENKIFTAGSTREGEEEIILDVFEKIKNKYNLIIVPRHIERVEKIELLIKQRNYEYLKWSCLKEEPKKNKIILVDTIGVLRDIYQISDVVFVGGTLVNIGGHSLLEPLYYKKSPIFGIYTQNVSDIAKEIEKREIGICVKNVEDFEKAIIRIEQNKLKIENIVKFFDENKNNLKITYNKIMNKELF